MKQITAKFRDPRPITSKNNRPEASMARVAKITPAAWPSLVAASGAAATGAAGRVGKWIPRVHRTAAAGPQHGLFGRRAP